jgi:hypothetical protein
MVEAVRLDAEREHARRLHMAGLPKSGFAAGVRRLIGASFIGVGNVIQGSSKADAQAEAGASS